MLFQLFFFLASVDGEMLANIFFFLLNSDISNALGLFWFLKQIRLKIWQIECWRLILSGFDLWCSGVPKADVSSLWPPPFGIFYFYFYFDFFFSVCSTVVVCVWGATAVLLLAHTYMRTLLFTIIASQPSACSEWMVRERRADWNKNYDIIVGLNCATEYYYIGVYIPTSDIHFYSLPSICDQQKKRKKKRTHTSCPCIRVSETTDNSAAHMRKPIAAAIYKSFAQCTNTWFSFFFSRSCCCCIGGGGGGGGDGGGCTLIFVWNARCVQHHMCRRTGSFGRPAFDSSPTLPVRLSACVRNRHWPLIDTHTHTHLHSQAKERWKMLRKHPHEI